MRERPVAARSHAHKKPSKYQNHQIRKRDFLINVFVCKKNWMQQNDTSHSDVGLFCTNFLTLAESESHLLFQHFEKKGVLFIVTVFFVVGFSSVNTFVYDDKKKYQLTKVTVIWITLHCYIQTLREYFQCIENNKTFRRRFLYSTNMKKKWKTHKKCIFNSICYLTFEIVLYRLSLYFVPY